MLDVLVNAYAVSPNKGSEPGMAWNWITNLADHCRMHVVTEAEFADEIRAAHESLPNRENLSFDFVDIGSDRIREMCWNQGDWRFYWFYRRWQLMALEQAKRIVGERSIDILHQLNMIGYREPGFLWRIDNLPFVWGPIGGFGEIPAPFLGNFPPKERLRQRVKNAVNRYQYRFGRVQSAIARADALLAANSAAFDVLSRYAPDRTHLVNDTASYEPVEPAARSGDEGLSLCWVGKHAPRKALFLACEVMQQVSDLDVVLNVVGIDSAEVPEFQSLPNVRFLGLVPHTEAMELMRSSDALLFTSLHEGTPHAVLESLHLGVPVLCHDAWGQGDVVDDTCGIKIPFRDPQVSIDGFASAIRTLRADAALLDRLRAGATRRAAAITWGRRAEVVAGIYRSVVAENVAESESS